MGKNIDKLKHQVERVQQRMKWDEHRECLLLRVQKWAAGAKAKISDATTFINAKQDAMCFNLRYGNKTSRKTDSLKEHRYDGNVFETSASCPYQRKDLENFDTQKSTLKEVFQVLEDDDTQIVGLVGLAGAGKTTLASEVAMEMSNRFAKIVFITLSPSVDVKMIREKVRVVTSLILQKKKVLIILDDVSEKLDLQDLGIPCGSRYTNCKILLTSRNMDVCVAMGATKTILVKPLTENEAWLVFQHALGDIHMNNRLKEVTFNIIKECPGLPRFVETLGTALRRNLLSFWETPLCEPKAPTAGMSVSSRL
ncbi:disease resistance protein UNI-like [Bidens hawaiensis]|uniref:disease resistance protein UNI-like n=1 Tax=Bidens hawaiensis TaxID=980011 RepID=UPI00404A0A9B